MPLKRSNQQLSENLESAALTLDWAAANILSIASGLVVAGKTDEAKELIEICQNICAEVELLHALADEQQGLELESPRESTTHKRGSEQVDTKAQQGSVVMALQQLHHRPARTSLPCSGFDQHLPPGLPLERQRA